MSTRDDQGLSLHHTTVRFGGLLALDDVSLRVPPGRVVGIIGPNGAGKTTLFNVICGFVAPQSGGITLDGRSFRPRPHHLNRHGIARTLQGVGQFGGMTVLDNVLVGCRPGRAETAKRGRAEGDGRADRHGPSTSDANGRIDRHGPSTSDADGRIDRHGPSTSNANGPIDRHGSSATEAHDRVDSRGSRVTGADGRTGVRPTSAAGWAGLLGLGALGTRGRRSAEQDAFAALERCGVADYADALPGALPYAKRKRVELARALVGNPRILLLDEPAGGLDVDEIEWLAELIRQAGTTILLVEHHMDLVMSVCDEILVLDFGKPIALGSPSEIRTDPKVAEAYLGAAA